LCQLADVMSAVSLAVGGTCLAAPDSGSPYRDLEAAEVAKMTVSVGREPAVQPAAAASGPHLPRLTGLDDQQLLSIAQSLPGEQGAAARELLVSRYGNLVRSCVASYHRGRPPAEDLMQVGYVGLMKAINHYDPAFGGSLAAYARPTIMGELKRYFRDTHWPVHIRRPIQELVLAVRAATEDLSHELGHAPAEADLAARLLVSTADLREARLAETAFRPFSLDAPLGDHSEASSLAELLGGEDQRIEHMLGMQVVAAHWDELPARERVVLMLRFHGDLSQAEIGRRVGVSQMQVSRLLSHALGYLRPYLLN
jgi:RNA polymerase sigma-B factor